MSATANTAARTWSVRLRQRAADWAQAPPGRRSAAGRLCTSRRVYILPTRGGFAFAGLLLVMLLAGLNYSNSMAMLITFLLAGFALIAMHLCHRNLVGTVVRSIDTVDAFAGEHARLLLTLENTADSTRIGLECATDDSERVLVDVPPDASARADVAIPLGARGRFPIERVKLSTAFPFGLFRAWTWIHVPLAVLAWPVPRGHREPPPRGRERRQRSGGACAAVTRNGPACASSATAIRRARSRGRRTHAAADCW